MTRASFAPQAPNEAALCYKEQWEEWAQQHGVQVRLLPFCRCCLPPLGAAVDCYTAGHGMGCATHSEGVATFGGAQRAAAASLRFIRHVCPLRWPQASVHVACFHRLDSLRLPQVITSTRDTFSDMFDDDQTLM